MDQRLDRHKEKWYSFWRLKCKVGYIDLWQGDLMHDPNEDEKPKLNLNSNTSYFRLNGKKWEHCDKFMRGSWHVWRRSAKESDALTLYESLRLEPVS